ncbi:MAG: formate dehydrogenase accessory sulfurtransferase FdhD [Saprospiraceae bacterium]|nr:formate dehydrogenase accessory sulfurtransferase FdhD [Saprospiraceae bacterium]
MEEKEIKHVNIHRHSEGSFFEKQDIIMVEEPLQISTAIQGKSPQSLSITMRSPGNDAQLALGFLYNEGIIQIGEKVTFKELPTGQINVFLSQQVDLKSPERNFYMTSSCGVCGKSSIDSLKIHAAPKKLNKKLNYKLIDQLYELMDRNQHAFNMTGGCHGAGVFTYDGENITVMEDVGRHNAVDKCAGELFLNNLLNQDEYILCLSGRSCFELIQKAIRMNCTTVIAIGAATSLAIETAKEFNITLIGFYKHYHFNIYTCKERII